MLRVGIVLVIVGIRYDCSKPRVFCCKTSSDVPYDFPVIVRVRNIGPLIALLTGVASRHGSAKSAGYRHIDKITLPSKLPKPEMRPMGIRFCTGPYAAVGRQDTPWIGKLPPRNPSPWSTR